MNLTPFEKIKIINQDVKLSMTLPQIKGKVGMTGKLQNDVYKISANTMDHGLIMITLHPSNFLA
jgi:hypothetical protein